MRTLCWCSRLELLLCPPSHMSSAAWLPMHGTTSTSAELSARVAGGCIFSAAADLFSLQRNLQTPGKIPAGKQGQPFIHRLGDHSAPETSQPTAVQLWSVFVLCAGLSFQDFYQRCREAFLVNSDLTLRTQLTEFKDHKLIRTRKVSFVLLFLSQPSVLLLITSSPFLAWYPRAQMEWSIWLLPWKQARWWTSWRMRTTTEKN